MKRVCLLLLSTAARDFRRSQLGASARIWMLAAPAGVQVWLGEVA